MLFRQQKPNSTDFPTGVLISPPGLDFEVTTRNSRIEYITIFVTFCPVLPTGGLSPSLGLSFA